MLNKKTAVIALLLIGLMFSVGVTYFYDSPQEEIKEYVCYPQYLSAVNGEVIEIQPTYFVDVKR